MADVHARRHSRGTLGPVFARASEQADVLLLCGDLTDNGTTEEAEVLAEELRVVKIRMVGVLGNHDYQSDKADQVARILTDAGVALLDGEAFEHFGVGFAGVKGFGGGFGEAMLQSWGEGPVKAFVHEALEEALKLERALHKLETPQRVVLLHYSPVVHTVVGENTELYPFLGTSRLEDALKHHQVVAVFHGHAHRGSLEGRTNGGVPVYNVAMPLLEREVRGRPPFRVVEIPVAP